MHSYLLCGWRTHSEIPLTGVATANIEGNVDVIIQVGDERPPLATSGGRFVFQHSVESSLIKIDGVADFEISGGRRISVWPAPGALQKDIEIFLFGQAWATLCHQRGMLPLHASAIVAGNGITAFAGRRGAGKSTTAALLNSIGYELVTDDILPVGFNQNSIPGGWPYLRRLKLHLHPANQLGLTATEKVSETLDNEKYFVFPRQNNENKWRRLERLYLLDGTGHSLAPIEEITGAEAVHTIIDQTYHFNFVLGTGRIGQHLELCSRLASSILCYRLRPLPLDDPEKVLQLLCGHFETVAK